MATTSIQAATNYIPLDSPSKDVKQIFGRRQIYRKPRFLHSKAISKILLESVHPPKTGQAMVRAIWTAEATHRATSLICLTMQMQSANSKGSRAAYAPASECELAKKLTDAYKSLEYYDKNRIASCEDSIQTIVRGLLAVFREASAVEGVSIQTSSVFLRVEKKRALVLLISELVIGMLLDGARRATASRLAISCSRRWHEGIDFMIETSCPLLQSFASPGYEIVCALAGILDAELLYNEPWNGGTCVRLLIPFERI